MTQRINSGWESPRPSAKAVLWTPQREIAVVYGRGADALTLPGGGIRRGETTEDALIREVREELGIQLFAEHLDYRGNTIVDVTSRSGVGYRAWWEVYEATIPWQEADNVAMAIEPHVGLLQNEEIAPATRLALARFALPQLPNNGRD